MITTSLELSKRLKDAAFPQDITVKESPQSQYVWLNEELHLVHVDNDTGWIIGKDYTSIFPDDFNRYGWFVSPTAEEIIEKLPKRLESSGDYFFLNCYWDGQWEVSYYSMNQDYTCYINDERIAVYGESLADTCALMYLHLKEHNLL